MTGPSLTNSTCIIAWNSPVATVRPVAGAPRTGPDWSWNNPIEAAREFAARHPEFSLEEPEFPFNEGVVKERVTYWPQGFLKRA